MVHMIASQQDTSNHQALTSLENNRSVQFMFILADSSEKKYHPLDAGLSRKQFQHGCQDHQ